MYVMCICLIYYGLGCEVDLLRSFMTLGGLPSLYEGKYVRVNVLKWGQSYLNLFKLDGTVTNRLG
jgi:hypothetical protein